MLCPTCGAETVEQTGVCENCSNPEDGTADQKEQAAHDENNQTAEQGKNYECVWFGDFLAAVYRYYSGQSTAEELKQAYITMRQFCENFERSEPLEFLSNFENMRNTEFGEELYINLSELLSNGSGEMTEGLKLLAYAVENTADTEKFQTGLFHMQNGINHFGVAEDMIRMHADLVEEEMRNRMTSVSENTEEDFISYGYEGDGDGEETDDTDFFPK